jgi:hypothetical protein
MQRSSFVKDSQIEPIVRTSVWRKCGKIDESDETGCELAKSHHIIIPSLYSTVVGSSLVELSLE